MDFEWDPAKDRENRQKHGISFDAAKAVFQDPKQIQMMKETISQTSSSPGKLPGDGPPVEEGETDWARLETMTGEEALRNALNDPDSQPLTPELRARLRRIPDPRRIRLSMNLTQEAFARRFEIALGTLRDWEQGVRIPDSTAKAYLRVIERNPEAVVNALTDHSESSR